MANNIQDGFFGINNIPVTSLLGLLYVPINPSFGVQQKMKIRLAGDKHTLVHMVKLSETLMGLERAA